MTTIEGLLELSQRPGDIDLLNRIFCGAHSNKGKSGMFGFTAVAQFTHKMDRCLLQSLARLKTLIDCARTEAGPDEAHVAAIGARLDACQDAPGAAAPKPTLKKPGFSSKPGDAKEPAGVAAGNGHDRRKKGDDFEEF